MKTLLAFASFLCLTALPAFGADGQIPNSSLARVGLSGMTPLSDVQGLEIRGMGIMEAMGMNDDDGNYKEHGHDKHEKHEKEHKHHEKHHEHKHHEKHENHFKCEFHPKPSCNFGNLCHVHVGKAG